MAESKSRKTIRKTKIEEENIIEDQPARVRRVSTERKLVRRLTPAPGMDDIAVPQEMESKEEPVDFIEHALPEEDESSNSEFITEESTIVTEDYSAEAMRARIAIDAQNIHSHISFPRGIPSEAPSEIKSQSFDDVSSSTPQKFNGVLAGNPTPKPLQDTNFLASEYTSFDLSPKKKKHWFSTFIIWLLTILIIIGVAATVILYVYPDQAASWYKDIQQKVLHRDDSTQNNNQQTSQSTATTTPTAPAQIKFGTDTTNTQIAQLINSSIQSKYSNFTVDSNVDTSAISPLNLNTDSLVYKSSVVDQVQQLSSYLLSQFGLQLQLQENDNIADDIVVYLTPTIASPNLNSETVLVSNANGTPGAAKALCKILTSYNSGACTSANATTTVKGTTVSYKDPKIYLILARIQQFTGATFQVAPTSQATDIVVTLGK